MRIFIIHSPNSINVANDFSSEVEKIRNGSELAFSISLSSDPVENKIGIDQFDNFKKATSTANAAIVIVSESDTKEWREELLIKYGYFLGSVGSQRTALVFQKESTTPIQPPAGLESIITLEWSSATKRNAIVLLTNWLTKVPEEQRDSSPLTGTEAVVLIEMYNRDDPFGYTTESYIDALVDRLTGTKAVVKGVITNLKWKNFIIERHINRVRTFFITDIGIRKVIEYQNRDRDVTAFTDKPEPFHTTFESFQTGVDDPS